LPTFATDGCVPANVDEHASTGGAVGVADVFFGVALLVGEEDVVGAALEVDGGAAVVLGALLGARGAANACTSATETGVGCCGSDAPAVTHTGTASAPTASTPAAVGSRHDFDPSRCLPDTSHRHFLVRKAATTLRIGHGHVTDK
jgi:hypothetical protein